MVRPGLEFCGAPHALTPPALNRPGPRPGLLFPIFSFTGTSVHADFLAPPIDQYDSPVGNDPCVALRPTSPPSSRRADRTFRRDWDDKEFEKIMWRGSTTGADLNIPHMRRWSQRPRLLSRACLPSRLPQRQARFSEQLADHSATSQSRNNRELSPCPTLQTTPRASSAPRSSSAHQRTSSRTTTWISRQACTALPTIEI